MFSKKKTSHIRIVNSINHTHCSTNPRAILFIDGLWYGASLNQIIEGKSHTLKVKPDGSLIGIRKAPFDNKIIGSWKVEEDLLVCGGIAEKSFEKIGIKFNKTTLIINLILSR